MKSVIQLCNYESAVERAANLNEWTEELHNHVQNCVSCATLSATVLGMRKLADDSIALAPKPEPKLLLLQSHMRKLRLQKRNQRMLVDFGLGACAIFSWVGLVLSRFYGTSTTKAALPHSVPETLQNVLPSSWAFCFLLVALAVVWIAFESDAAEQHQSAVPR